MHMCEQMPEANGLKCCNNDVNNVLLTFMCWWRPTYFMNYQGPRFQLKMSWSHFILGGLNITAMYLHQKISTMYLLCSYSI